MSEKELATTHLESINPFTEYLDKMRELERAIKLVAYCTRECAEQAEKAADYALLAVYHVKEYLHEKAE